MTQVKVDVFDTTLQKTHLWLKSLMDKMGWEDYQWAYLSLRAVLHALRDRLPVNEAVKLGAQLPLLIRGIYYEGWVPAETPLKIRHKEDFLNIVKEYLGRADIFSQEEGEKIVCNVFNVMQEQLSKEEIAHLKNLLPAQIVSLLP